MRTSRSNLSQSSSISQNRRESRPSPSLASSYETLPRASTLQGAMQNARYLIQHRSITTPQDQDLASGLRVALNASQFPARSYAHRYNSPISSTNPRVTPAISSVVVNRNLLQNRRPVFPSVIPQNNQVPQSILEIIGPVMRGIGKRFLPGFDSTVVGIYNSNGIGQPLGKTIRYEESRKALVLLNLDVSADIDNATYDQRQASYAATLAHEYLRHVLPFMRSLLQQTEEESDDEEHRQIFLPADINTNEFYREMCDVCDELPPRLQRQFMQSYPNSIATQIDKLATDSVIDDAEDFLDDVINSHGLK